MKILILGSEGFIGSHLVSFYIENGHEVFGCDLFENASANYLYSKVSLVSEDINLLFNGIQYDACINAAGNGNVGYSLSHPLSDFENNVYAVSRILNAIKTHAPSCFFIHISSAAVYGNPDQLPVKEEDDINPISTYGWNKYISELACREYSTIYELKTAIVRPFSVYGPGLKKQLFWDLYKKVKTDAKTIEVWGTGNESRDFIFISDLVNAIDFVLKKGRQDASVYNVGFGEEVCIRDAAKAFFEYLDPELELKFNGIQKHGDPLNWRADIFKISQLGFSPSVNYKQGLKLVAAWLKSQN